MAHCWDEYMWKVHKAVPVDPWATNVQLLDVLIQERSTCTSQLWQLPSWLRKPKASSSISRVGSMLTLGLMDTSLQQVVTNVSGDDAIGKNGAAFNQLNNNISSGAAHHGPPTSDSANSETAAHSLHLVLKADNNATSNLLLPNISDTNSDVGHTVQLIKNSSGNPLPNKHTPNVDTAAVKHVVNDFTNRKAPAKSQHIRQNSDTIMKAINNTLLIKGSSMPDIQASIRSSTSLLASITGGASASAQFDVKGSKTVTCNVDGVKSQHVDVDALMELVTPRTSSGLPALWQPNISLPQLQWSSKRGQTLWVVTEIMYANSIKIEGDNQGQATAKAKVSKGEAVEVSEKVGVEKEGMWRVTAPKDNPTFPFAVRLQRLNYDAGGSLVSTNRTNLKRYNSVNNRTMRPLSSTHAVDALARSASVSHIVP